MNRFIWIIINLLAVTSLMESRPILEEQQTPADKRMWKPPIFPYWGPFGWHSSAILCPFMSGPYMARGCAGPVPPFTTTPAPSPPPPPPSTTTAAPIPTVVAKPKPPPPDMEQQYYYESSRYNDPDPGDDDDGEEDENDESDQYDDDYTCAYH